MKEEKRKIDIITENNFKEISSTPTSRYLIAPDPKTNERKTYYTLYKTFSYVDTEFSFLESCVTLKALYYEHYEDIDTDICIYKAERLVFEGKIDTEEEFKILLKMLSL